MSEQKMMKAVVTYGPGDMRYEDYPKPVPGEGEILLKMKGCSICAGDLKCPHKPFLLLHSRMIPEGNNLFYSTVHQVVPLGNISKEPAPRCCQHLCLLCIPKNDGTEVRLIQT